MNERTLTIIAAVMIYAARVKGDDMPEQRAKVLAEALEEAKLVIFEVAAKVIG